MKRLMTGLAVAYAALIYAAHGAGPAAAETFITVASTTSTQNSGLYDHILPKFTNKTGIQVRVVAVGTGQAIRLAENGDADVLLVHHKASEEKFVKAGYGVKRTDVMYNDFVIVGPKSDPAGIKGAKDVAKALITVKDKGAPFFSRGDRSGTHSAELALWKTSGVDIEKDKGTWYKSLGQGMGATLNTAAASNGYTLTDRATWINFKNKQDLAIAVEGDRKLFNQYGVMLVNPAKCPSVKKDLGQAFIDYLVSPHGQQDIAGYRIDGQSLFFPNATDAGT